MATKKTEASKRRTVRLQTNADCRRFMARLINATWQGRISTEEGRALSYMVTTLARINEADLEARLDNLEAKLESITTGAEYEPHSKED